MVHMKERHSGIESLGVFMQRAVWEIRLTKENVIVKMC